MIVLLAILAGAIGAVLGWAVTSVLAVVIMGYFGVSDFEGARGMLAFLGIGPIGGVLTMIAAIVLVVRRGRRGGNAGGMVGTMLAALAGLGLLVTGGLYFLNETQPYVTTNGPAPRLVFEIRLPAGQPAPSSPRGYEVELNTDMNTMPANPAGEWLRMEGDRAVLLGNVEVAYRTSKRMLVLKVEGQPVRIFTIGLAANPSRMIYFGPWRRVDFIDDRKADSQPREPPPGETVEMRYRLDRED